MKKRVLLILFLFILAETVRGQNLSGIKDQIEAYLNLLHSNPDQIPLIESRLSYELKDSSSLMILKSQILKRLNENPDEWVYAELLAWNYIQQKDFEKAFIQEIALDKRSREEGFRLLNLGRITAHNKAYEVSLKAYNYILELIPKSRYYRLAKKERLETRESQILESRFQKTDFAGLYGYYRDYLSEFQDGEDVNQVKLSLAKLDIGYLDKLGEAEALIQEILKSPQPGNEFKAQAKMVLAEVNVLKGNIWEAALLYGQVHSEFKEESLGQEASFEAARLYYYSGDFTLAKSQLDVLKTATSELTSNDAIDLSLLIQKNLEEDSTGKALKEFARSELLIQQHKYRESEKIMDSLEVKYPHNALKDDILMARYRIHFSEGNYAQAAVNLQTLIDLYPKGIWADDALFHLAELNENQFKQGTKAGSLYEKLFILYPGSFYAGESRKRFRKLRGDTLN